MSEEEIEKIIEMTINKSNKEYISLKKEFEELRNDYIELARIEEKQEDVLKEIREYILNHELIEEQKTCVLNKKEILEIIDKGIGE